MTLGNTRLPFLELSDTTLVYEGWTASGKAHALLSARRLQPTQAPPTPGDNPNG